MYLVSFDDEFYSIKSRTMFWLKWSTAAIWATIIVIEILIIKIFGAQTIFHIVWNMEGNRGYS